MNSHRQTKQALLTSVMALVMCVVMLLGTTFAWFTDTARTSVNKIEAGNLDVALYYGDTADGANGTNWTELVDGSPALKFLQSNGTTATQQDFYWEPGGTYSLPALKVANNGNLKLKYKIEITGIKGSDKLNEVIDWTMKLGSDEFVIGSEHVLNAATAGTESADILTISGHMWETAGNIYMNEKIEGITITLKATQATGEYDSTRNDYDKFAEYPEVTTVQIAAGEETAVNEAVKNAITAAKTVDSTTGKTTPTQIVLPANTTVTLESRVATPAQGQTADIKITGDKTTTVKLQNNNPGYEGPLSYQDNANLTFQGITIDSGEITGICARGGVVTFIDCTFNGELKKTIASKFVFSSCTFTQPVSQVGYGCKDVVFDDCEFNTDGYGIKIYSEGSTPVNLTVKNCAFKNTNNAAKSAIFLDHIKDGISYNITVDSCTFDGFNATPTPNYNAYAAREIVTGSFVKTADGQYIFSYQTGAASGSYHKILTADQLVVTVKP